MQRLNDYDLHRAETAIHFLTGSNLWHGDVVTVWNNGGLQFPKKPDTRKDMPVSLTWWKKTVVYPLKAILPPGAKKVTFQMNNGRLMGEPIIL